MEHPHPPLDSYPIARPFSWYALVHGDRAESYDSHVLHLGECRNLREFCQYLNHVPSPGDVFDGAHAWRIASKHWGYGICFFETATRPEWEHANNQGGVDLVCRGSFSSTQLTDAWRSLLLMFINGQLEDATGARVAMKRDRRGAVLHKLEVWTRAAEGGSLIQRLRRELGLDFVCTPRRLGK